MKASTTQSSQTDIRLEEGNYLEFRRYTAAGGADVICERPTEI